MDRPVVYLDLKLTKFKLNLQLMPRYCCYDVAVTKHPLFAQRSVKGELVRTVAHMKQRRMPSGVFKDLKTQEERIRQTDFDMNKTKLLPD
eukprot:1281023-Pleurochrysis_carterae.AAC.1